MKFSVVIIALVSIFTWNAFANETSIEKLNGETKIIMPELKSLELPTEQLSPSTQVVQCKFEGQRAPASLNNSSWNVIANGATSEKRTITLFNSNSNEVLMMNCYKFQQESPRKTAPVSDSQVIQVLKASQIKII